MKKYLFAVVFSLIFFSAKAQLKILSSGEVTIPFNKSLWFTNSTSPGDNGYRLRMYNNGSHAYLDYYNNLYFRSGYSSLSNTVTFLSTGKVGIGITNPSKQLHIKDNNDEIQLFLENDYVAGDMTKSGAGIRFENANNYNYYLINESNNGWGHTNTLDFRNIDNILMQLFPDQHVGINGWLGVDFYVKLFHDQTASFLGAAGYDFNTISSMEGLILEQRYGEGSGFYADGDFAAIWSPGDQNRLLRLYDEDGMVEKWYVDGVGYEHTNSDSTKKDNIRRIENSFDQLKQLQGVKFRFKKEENIETENDVITGSDQPKGDSIFPGDIRHIVENKYDPSQKEYYGFLAQDVEKVYPEIVGTNEKGDKFISYMQFIPILVEAFKEQQLLVEAQSLKIKELEHRINEIDTQNATLKSTIVSNGAKPVDITTNAFLFQNIPNPFTYDTEIKYFIPDGTINAELYIFTLQGTLLKNIKIDVSGFESSIISGSELQPGMYVYTLVIDGKEVDTKRMILTK